MSIECSSTITFCGTAQELMEINKKVTNDKGDFDCQKVCNDSKVPHGYGTSTQIDISEEGTLLEFEFTTNNWGPMQVFKDLAKMFPNTPFTVESTTWDLGTYITGKGINGEFTSECHELTEDSEEEDIFDEILTKYRGQYIYIDDPIHDCIYMKVSYVSCEVVDSQKIYKFIGFAFNCVDYAFFCEDEFTSWKLTSDEVEKYVQIVDEEKFTTMFIGITSDTIDFVTDNRLIDEPDPNYDPDSEPDYDVGGDLILSYDKTIAWECSQNVSKVIIPDMVVTIKDGAFVGCKSLTEISVPASVTEVEEYAFKGCDNLVVKLAKKSPLKDSDFADCKEVVRIDDSLLEQEKTSTVESNSNVNTIDPNEYKNYRTFADYFVAYPEEVVRQYDSVIDVWSCWFFDEFCSNEPIDTYYLMELYSIEQFEADFGQVETKNYDSLSDFVQKVVEKLYDIYGDIDND